MNFNNIIIFFIVISNFNIVFIFFHLPLPLLLCPGEPNVLRVADLPPLVRPELRAACVVHQVLRGALGRYEALGAKGVAQVKRAMPQLVGYNKQVGVIIDEAHLPLQRHVAGHIAPLVLHCLHEEEVEGAALQAVTSKNALQYSKKT